MTFFNNPSLNMNYERHLSECPVCLNVFRDPKILPCHHTFCNLCVIRLTKLGFVRCPTCKAETSILRIKADFRLNQFLEALSEKKMRMLLDHDKKKQIEPEKLCLLCEKDIQAYWCTQCDQGLCKSCKTVHLKSKVSAEHTCNTLPDGATHSREELVDNWDSFFLHYSHKVQANILQLKQNAEVIKQSTARCYEELNKIEREWNGKIFSMVNSIKREVRETLRDDLAKTQDKIRRLSRYDDDSKFISLMADRKLQDFEINPVATDKALRLIEKYRESINNDPVPQLKLGEAYQIRYTENFSDEIKKLLSFRRQPSPKRTSTPEMKAAIVKAQMAKLRIGFAERQKEKARLASSKRQNVKKTKKEAVTSSSDSSECSTCSSGSSSYDSDDSSSSDNNSSNETRATSKNKSHRSPASPRRVLGAHLFRVAREKRCIEERKPGFVSRPGFLGTCNPWRPRATSAASHPPNEDRPTSSTHVPDDQSNTNIGGNSTKVEETPQNVAQNPDTAAENTPILESTESAAELSI